MHAATRRAQRAEQETSHSPRSVIMTTAKVAVTPTKLRRGVASEEAALAARHRRNSQMDRLDLCTQLQQFDVWSAQYVADTSKELMQDLGEPADRLVPLFAELFAAKDLSTKYTERRVSLGTQEQLANHAAYFLRDSIAAIDKQVESQGVLPLAHFEKLGFGPARIDPARAEKLKQRFEGQIEECMDERDYAQSILAALEPATGPTRVIEVAVAAKQADLEKEIDNVLRRLRKANDAANEEEAAEAAIAGSRGARELNDIEDELEMRAALG